jgi:phenylalanyl-tRNA synthetase alpha chain
MQEQLSSLLAKAAAELPDPDPAGVRGGQGPLRGPQRGVHGPDEADGLRAEGGAARDGQARERVQGAAPGAPRRALRRIEASELAARSGRPIDPTLPVARPGTGHLPPADARARGGVPDPAQGRLRGGRRPRGRDGVLLLRRAEHAPDHPARDPRTRSISRPARFGNVSKHEPGERYLLRTHTSSVQVRTMLKGPPPIRIVSPGRVYRRDTTDASHSANFHQIECLYVDRGVTVRDLKALLDYLFEALLGPGTKTRFRPHYFGYTEPSFEVDLSAKHLPKVNKEWIEIGGCGMVDPEVFKAVGYDPEVWTGYAFGMGIERLAMTALRHRRHPRVLPERPAAPEAVHRRDLTRDTDENLAQLDQRLRRARRPGRGDHARDHLPRLRGGARECRPAPPARPGRRRRGADARQAPERRQALRVHGGRRARRRRPTIVCGAQNYKVGDRVPVALPGRRASRRFHDQAVEDPRASSPTA